MLMVPAVVAVSCNQGYGVLRELYPVFFEAVLNSSLLYLQSQKFVFYFFVCRIILCPAHYFNIKTNVRCLFFVAQ